MEKSPSPASASAGAATPEEKAQEEKARRRWVPQWTGFARKTLWDWLQLLIVPAILIGVTFVWSASQTRSDNKREDRRIAADRAAAEEARQDATLQGYLDQMSGLMLREKLLTSFEGSGVQAVARTVTLTALRRLDGERKGAAVRFLHEAGLLGPPSFSAAPVFRGPGGGQGRPLVRLSGADLRGADFGDAFLPGADLTEVDLTGANLMGAVLPEAILEGTYLRRAHLTRAFLRDARLGSADLRGAFLAGADLRRAELLAADLRGADLQGASLQRARLGGADLDGADLSGANLVGAKLVDASPYRIGLVAGLDLGRYIADLTPKQQKEFLDSQEEFLDSLSREQLSKFNLSPEELARIRREASGG
jgi:uncharacterized protein YjbI with pentapeptide repeats